MARVRVGLSLLTLVPGISGGSETYARGLARALAARSTAETVAFVPTLAPDAGEGLASIVVDAYRASTSTPGRLLAMGRAAVAPGPIRRPFSGLDVVHYPLTVPVPSVARTPAVVTLHDLQHHDLPRLFPRGERLFRRLAYDRAGRRADAVVVPSAFVADRATALLDIAPGRLHVIPHGVDHDRFSPGGEEQKEELLLYPARPWPHKNHGTLLEAFALLRRERPELRLVLTGAGTERFAGLDGVEARGAVPLDELVALYRRAACCVVPSRYEGFGAPPLEAMACGTPVACARSGSLPEVCGDAAVLFDPERPEAIAAAVAEALAAPEDLAGRGLARARLFTWDRSAASHEEVYASLTRAASLTG
ncbi:MAG: glycosyltransferase family 4 protein [Actinobacteria bacterium]|nr:glycosyltransferase family 4 protein [Actinomycetota bacterium]